MKPDAYMPVYWNEFWMAVEGLPDSIIVAYQRCFSYYYHHNHCRGLPDDNEFLRKLCRCDKSDWEYVRGTIFNNDRFFTQDRDGLWHQKRTEQEWNKSKEKYEKAVTRAKAGARGRWKKKR
jgi:uncharacterized protein YdaU (DUF1376 family)